jgi:hypothetical protein
MGKRKKKKEKRKKKWWDGDRGRFQRKEKKEKEKENEIESKKDGELKILNIWWTRVGGREKDDFILFLMRRTGRLRVRKM